MPEVRVNKRRQTAKERLREIIGHQKAKKAGGKKLTIDDLEARLELIETIMGRKQET